ncbi:unnamed protein product, partial [Effrenium voratum]
GARPSDDGGCREAEGIFAQLLEQASDLNDELCRENCELRSEASALRQRQLQRMKRDAEGSRRSKVRKLMPRAMSNIKALLRDLAEPEELAGVEEAAHRVFATWAELDQSQAVASGEETAALIAEKVALKEFCIRQQERLLELEVAKEKLGSSFSWAERLTSALGTLSEAAPQPSTELPPQVNAPAPLVQVGDECQVVGRKGAILRETEDLQSALVATVVPGGHVRIVQVAPAQSRRALVEVIDSPEAEGVEVSGACAAVGSVGWLSVSTKDGKALVRPREKEPTPSPEAEPKAEAAPSAPSTPSAPSASADAAAGRPHEVARRDEAPAPEVEPAGEGEPTKDVAETMALQETTQDANPDLPKEADASPGQGAVTVSTEAWTALRQERGQRERHIKALHAQVSSAQTQLQHQEEVKAKLRELRQQALEARQRGQEFLETLRMATEEIRMISGEAAQQGAGEEPSAPPIAPEPEPATEHPQPQVASGVDEDGLIEWRRLLSERETTARELAATLQQVEEMEREVEDRRIELDIAQRRRDRERRSLLTALRELGYWQGDEESAGMDTDGSDRRTSDPTPSGSSQDKERQYLQRISELEETASKLQVQIDTVQARIAKLNQQAVTRQQALRYAASLPSVGGLADAFAARLTSRPDLDGLTEMLGRLFVENFDLRRKRGAVQPTEPPESRQGLDLSRFAVPAGADSDDELLAEIPSASSPVRSLLPDTEVQLPRPFVAQLDLDFSAMSVAE